MNQSWLGIFCSSTRICIPESAFVVVDDSRIGVRNGIFSAQRFYIARWCSGPFRCCAKIVFIGAIACVAELRACVAGRMHHQLQVFAFTFHVEAHIGACHEIAIGIFNHISVGIRRSFDHRREVGIQVGRIQLPQSDAVCILSGNKHAAVFRNAHFARIVRGFSVRE